MLTVVFLYGVAILYSTHYCIIRKKKKLSYRTKQKNRDETKKKDCAKDDEKGSLEKANQ